MNKEEVTAVMDDLKVKQDLYHLHKLEKEYNHLSDKCNKLYKFIYSLDFADKVRNADEQILLQEQHKRMEAYRTNLYQRIQFYRNLIAINNGYDILTPWCEVAEKIDQEAVESAAHHCGQDAANFEQDDMEERLTDAYKNYYRGVFEQYPSREITWAKFVEKAALPFCHENINEFVNATKEECHHCGQDADDADDACCQVRAGRVDHDAAPAAVKELPDSIAQLVGMQIVSAFRPGWKCEECAFSHIEGARCEKKVELVGGYYLCLATINIVTE